MAELIVGIVCFLIILGFAYYVEKTKHNDDEFR